MPYTASRQDLYGSVGGVQPPTTQVDVPGAIDAFTRGATSLIHGAVLRRQAQNQIDMERQRVDIEKAREGREAEAQQWERGFKEQEAQRKFLLEGGVPPTVDAVPGRPTTTAPLNSPIRRAMTNGLPGPGVTPTNGSPMGPIAAPMTPATTAVTPEHVDPTKASTFIRAAAVANLRNEGWVRREDVKQEGERDRAEAQAVSRERISAAGNKSREEIAAMNRDARAGTARGALTGNAKLNAAVATVHSLLVSEDGGDLGKMYDRIEKDPVWRGWADEVNKANIGGVDAVLRAAHDKYLTERRHTLDRTVGSPVMSQNQGVSRAQTVDRATAGTGGTARRFNPGAAATPPDEAKETAAKAAWAKANPPTPGESREKYRARYEASKGKP